MLHAELKGEPYSKAAVNQQLREGPLKGRTKGSIEFRMQNISAALYELKLPRIDGYLPAKNIGTAVKEKLNSILYDCGIDKLSTYAATSDPNQLAARVSQLRKQQIKKTPAGNRSPSTASSMTTTYVRDPAVKAWVLQNANGKCEGCDEAAPFLGQDSLPYLEVHHVMPLASHGSDTTTNAVALCPNCHRRCHYSIDRDAFKLELYRRISRLVLEVSVESSAAA